MKHKRVEMVMRRCRAFGSLNFIYGLSSLSICLLRARVLTNNKYKHNLLSLDLSFLFSLLLLCLYAAAYLLLHIYCTNVQFERKRIVWNMQHAVEHFFIQGHHIEDELTIATSLIYPPFFSYRDKIYTCEIQLVNNSHSIFSYSCCDKMMKLY